MQKRCVERRRGFTLVEMVVAVALSAVAMLLVLSSFSSISLLMSTTRHNHSMRGDMRNAMMIFQRDATRGIDISEWSATNRVRMLTARHGVSTGTVDVVYEVLTNALVRIADGATNTLATGVQGVDFTLYDKQGATTVAPGSAFFVGMDLHLDRQSVRTNYTDRLQARARMRRKNL